MLLSNQVKQFFDQRYLWKDSINILDFLDEDSHYRKLSTEIVTFGWVCQGVCSDTQAYIDLLGAFDWAGVRPG